MSAKIKPPKDYGDEAFSWVGRLRGVELRVVLDELFAACQHDAIQACRSIALDNARSLTGVGQGMAADIAEEINALALATKSTLCFA